MSLLFSPCTLWLSLNSATNCYGGSVYCRFLQQDIIGYIMCYPTLLPLYVPSLSCSTCILVIPHIFYWPKYLNHDTCTPCTLCLDVNLATIWTIIRSRYYTFRAVHTSMHAYIIVDSRNTVFVSIHLITSYRTHIMDIYMLRLWSPFIRFRGLHTCVSFMALVFLFLKAPPIKSTISFVFAMLHNICHLRLPHKTLFVFVCYSISLFTLSTTLTASYFSKMPIRVAPTSPKHYLCLSLSDDYYTSSSSSIIVELLYSCSFTAKFASIGSSKVSFVENNLSPSFTHNVLYYSSFHLSVRPLLHFCCRLPVLRRIRFLIISLIYAWTRIQTSVVRSTCLSFNQT